MTSTASLPRPAITSIQLPGDAPTVVLSAGLLRLHQDAARFASAQLMVNRRIAGQGVKAPAAPRRLPLVVQLPSGTSAVPSGRLHRRTHAPITV